VRFAVAAAFLGFLLVVYLIIDSGAAQVAHAMLVIGWGLIPITLYHLIPFTLSALSWRELLPPASRPRTVTVIWIRWIRESINTLLPVASIGGDVASMRLVHLRGVPGAQAASSVIVDTTVGVVTQLIFVLSGVALLLMRSTDRNSLLVAGTVLLATGILFVAITAFVVLQHRGLFAGSTKFARRLMPAKWLSALTARAPMIDAAVVAAYRNGPVMLRASPLRFLGWAAGTGEIWLVMHSLGQPIGVVDAYILESLGSGVRAATFMLPGALGALDGSYILFGAMFGLPADTALAISLSKRVRELALGVPGLLLWQYVEGRYHLRRGKPNARGSRDTDVDNAVNLQGARAPGIAVPDSIQLLANKAIEGADFQGSSTSAATQEADAPQSDYNR
jgi:putative membrane protein